MSTPPTARRARGGFSRGRYASEGDTHPRVRRGPKPGASFPEVGDRVPDTFPQEGSTAQAVEDELPPTIPDKDAVPPGAPGAPGHGNKSPMAGGGNGRAGGVENWRRQGARSDFGRSTHSQRGSQRGPSRGSYVDLDAPGVEFAILERRNRHLRFHQDETKPWYEQD